MRYQTYVHERNWGARLTEFECRGYTMLSIENRYIRIVVAAGKGTDILEFLYKPFDTDFMWRSYAGLRPARNFIPTVENPLGNFIDFYGGGWQEMLPNAGWNCVYKGAPLGMHGELCLLPWSYHIERNEPDNVTVTFNVRTLRTPFHVEKTLRINGRDPVLFIEEVVRNEAGEPMDFMWGHHPAMGWPFIDDSCRLFLPRCRVRTPEEYFAPTSRLERGQDTDWPFVRGRKGETIDLSRFPTPEVSSHDMAFGYDFEDGWFAVVNVDRDVGFGLSWERETFPFLWLWQVYGGGVGYPWFTTNYTVAVEPVSSYPITLSEAIKARTQLVLGPGEERRTRLVAVAFTGHKKVQGINLQGKVI